MILGVHHPDGHAPADRQVACGPIFSKRHRAHPRPLRPGPRLAILAELPVFFGNSASAIG